MSDSPDLTPQMQILGVFMGVTALVNLGAGLSIGVLLMLIGGGGTLVLLVDASVPDREVFIAVYGTLAMFGLVLSAITSLGAGIGGLGAYQVFRRDNLLLVYAGLFANTVMPAGTVFLSLMTCQCSLLMIWMPGLVLALVTLVLGFITLGEAETREQFGWKEELFEG